MYEPDLWSMYGQQQQQQYPGHPLQQQLPFQHPSYQQPSLYDACLVVPGTSAVSPIAAESSPRCCWSRDEDKAFENALVRFPEDAPDRWDRVAAMVPGKSAAEVAQHFEALVQDVDDIETGRIRFPEYFDEDEDPESPTGCGGRRGGGGNKSKEERKKGVPWTEDEHRRFLDGLQKYGKGDWRSISRNSVVTRTPTQVASHAQKYFLRLNSSGRKEKKRGSIHDITEP